MHARMDTSGGAPPDAAAAALAAALVLMRSPAPPSEEGHSLAQVTFATARLSLFRGAWKTFSTDAPRR